MTYLYLGQAEQGAAAAQAALGEIGDSFIRNLALTSLYLGICHARSPKPDVNRAANAISEAARLAAHNRSPRLNHQLNRSWADLERWRTEPEVAQVHEQLRAYGIL